MKHKLFVACLVGCIIIAGCKSRFTSTSDASGPRKHEHADPSFQHSGNMEKNSMLPIETTDSGRGNQMNTRTDSINAVTVSPVKADTANAAGINK